MSAVSSIAEFDQAFSITEQQVRADLENVHNWESKYRNIMLLGKRVPTLGLPLQIDEALVQGCESKVWLHHQWQDDKIILAASSDAKIVKGLVAAVLAVYQHKSAEQIANFDVEAYFEQLGLLKQLSPSRVNGIHAIVEQIKGF